jgi:hypothetical protein
MPLFIVSFYEKLTIKRGIIHIIVKVLFKVSFIKARLSEVKKKMYFWKK